MPSPGVVRADGWQHVDHPPLLPERYSPVLLPTTTIENLLSKLKSTGAFSQICKTSIEEIR